MPTLEEIELFQKGKLSAAREAEIKALASSNPLVAEALEGFAILPVFTAVPGAESFLNMVSNAPGSAAASGTASSAAASSGAASTSAAIVTDVALKTAAWFGAKTIIIAGVSATIAVTGTLLVVNHYSDEPTTAQNTAVSPSQSTTQTDNSIPSTEESPAPSALDSQSGETPSQSDNAASGNTTVAFRDAQNQFNTGTAVANQDASNSDVNLVENESSSDNSSNPNYTQVSAIPVDSEVAIPRADISGKVMAIGIQSILHYKVADYTKVVKEHWTSFEVDPGGVPAQFESEEAKRAAQEEEEVIKEIPYLDYLTLCIRAMDNKDYALALSQFQIVLDQYPDDVNGLFYSAQCNYYLGNYDKAIGFYDQTMRNMINKFNEESEFYKAKSLQALGRSDDAKKLFESIVAKGKFYSQQAEKELE
ncbi:MAG: tetratricopeptide repeat protein [Flavobacteriales bacterium]